MDTLVAVIIIFTFFIGAFVVLSIHTRQMAVRRALPLREDYLQKNPSAGCSRCDSTEQREFGLDDSQDHKRIVACAACGRELFQFIDDSKLA